MLGLEELQPITINPKAQKLFRELLDENPRLETILKHAESMEAAVAGLNDWAMEVLKDHPEAVAYYKMEATGRQNFERLTWQDYAAIRILDYADHGGRMFEDLNLQGKLIANHPIALLWYAANQGTGGATPDFFEDMIHLFRQFTGRSIQVLPSGEKVLEWMQRHPTGLDPETVKIREENRDRILSIIIQKLSDGEMKSKKYNFEF